MQATELIVTRTNDRDAVIDDTLLMEEDPVVQQRLLETETSLYGSLVNPRGTCYLQKQIVC